MAVLAESEHLLNQSQTMYAELHCISNFSFLRGASHPEELICTAAELGYEALALTDECSVAGVVRAYQAIRDQQLDIKLIIGSEFLMDADLHLVLLCPDRQAYAELCRLITTGRRRCNKGSYQLFLSDLESIQHCLLLWLPSGNSEVDYHHGRWLQAHFHERLWIAYERHLEVIRRQPPQTISGSWKDYLKSPHRHYCNHLSVHFKLPVVASGGIYMHSPKRQRLLDVLTATRFNQSLVDCGYRLCPNAEHSLRPAQKLRRLFPADWLEESRNIADRCHFELGELRYEYPAELVPQGMSATRYLRQLVEQGIRFRFPDGVSPEILAIIEKELRLIQEQQYEYFFLTIYDIVQFAKRQGILYQGRGSAANSIVCYCLEITAVDPRQIHVLFERFISKERDEPPDIDVDFEHERREEIFQYIYTKYGRQRAAIAATVITFRFKSALRCVGKALGIHESQIEFYLRQINRRDRELSWQQQLRDAGLDGESHVGRDLIDLTEEIIGFPRHLSQHVGGFIISSGPLYELVPVENAAMENRTVIQWDKDDIENLGLLKVDILALGMLSAIRKSFQLIQQHWPEHATPTIADITRREDDPLVYQLLQRADSIGVFQVESRAQMSMLPRLKPACYYDLVIQIAIVRPGPIQGDMVHPYLRRRHKLEHVTYPSEAVKQVLSRTLGVPIFQEQVIQLAMVAAGFSGGEADQLRRAMASWKKNGKLQLFRDKLVQGMLQRGYQVEFAERIFQQICGFGEYGFPESHSASFAVLAYVSAWLKYYYPQAFYCGLLNSQPMGFYSPSQLVQDARRHQIKILPVDINASHYDHCLQPVDGELAIRLGFRLVKSLSKMAVQNMLARRPEGGFQTLLQIRQYLPNRRDLEALASANAFRSLSGHRYQSRWEIMQQTPATPLFGTHDSSTEIKHRLPPPDEVHELQEDYHSLGLSLDFHPVLLLRRQGLLSHCTMARDLGQHAHQSIVSVAGLVTCRQSPGTASGVTFVTLEDETGNINVVIWQATARAQKKSFLTARLLKIKGIVEREGNVIHVIAGKLIDLSHHLQELSSRSRDFH